MNLTSAWLAAILMSIPALGLGAQLLVLNKSEASLSFIDPESGKTNARVAVGDGPHEIELSSDGRVAYVSNYGAQTPGNSLSIIDVAGRKERERVDLGDLRRPHGLTFSNGYLYFTAEQAKRVARYNPETRRVDWSIETGQVGTHMVLASRDGARLFATNIGSNSVSILERGTGSPWTQKLITVGAGPEALDLTPDGTALWVAHSRDGGISILDPVSGKVLQTFAAKTQRSNRLKFTRDGRLVLISDLSAGELVILDARQHTERARLKVGRTPTGILILPDGAHAYVAVSGENRIAVIDLKTLTVAKTLPTGRDPDGMAWSTL